MVRRGRHLTTIALFRAVKYSQHPTIPNLVISPMTLMIESKIVSTSMFYAALSENDLNKVRLKK